MCQLVCVVCWVHWVYGKFFRFRGYRHGNALCVADRNARLARELWIERFPNHAIPWARTFVSVVQHLRDHGSFKPQTHDRGRDRTERILQAEEQILERVEEEPDLSSRRLASEVAVSQFVVKYDFNDGFP